MGGEREGGRGRRGGEKEGEEEGGGGEKEGEEEWGRGKEGERGRREGEKRKEGRMEGGRGEGEREGGREREYSTEESLLTGLTMFTSFWSNPQMRKSTFSHSPSRAMSAGHTYFPNSLMRVSLGKNSPSPTIEKNI